MKRRRGVVLLLTVALIGFASVAMVRLANRSLSTIARGTMAHEELQQRWSMASCRLSILSRAEDVFQRQEERLQSRGMGWPLPSEVEFTVSLNDEELHIVLRDEQARVNVNTLYRRNPVKLSSQIARSATASSVRVHLQPLPESGGNNLQQSFVAWGQVADLSRVSRARSILDVLEPLTATFTCWGDGRVNLRRASDEALRLAVQDTLDAIETNELLKLRRGYQGSAETLLSSLDIHRRTQLRVKQLLSEESHCYSLIVAKRDANRNFVNYIVHDPSDRGASDVRVFYW